jgi:hypothetical protein
VRGRSYSMYVRDKTFIQVFGKKFTRKFQVGDICMVDRIILQEGVD